MLRDITQVQHLDILKREFVSVVSHELRTPLTCINGALSLICNQNANALQHLNNDMLDIAKRNCDRLNFLIDDLLDMESLLAGEMNFKMEACALSSLLSTAVKTNKPMADKLEVVLELLPCHGESVWVCVDEDRLIQVVTNLLSNAIKFSPRKGTVSVSIENRDERNKVRVIVKDEGSGIPEKFKQDIFKQFSQADSTDRRRTGGTGLGLAITKALVEKMNGTIGFQSREGHGTSFFVEFPKVSQT